MKIALLAYDNCLASSIALPLEMFNAANDALRIKKRHKYETPPVCETIVIGKSKVSCAGNLSIQTDARPGSIDAPDLLLLPAIWRNPFIVVKRERALLRHIKKWWEAGSKICAVGSSTTFLAEAGLLDQRAATTHWTHMEQFRQRYAQVHLKNDFLITQSDNIFCVSSVNSVADLVIYFIEEFFDSTTAQRVEANFSPEIRKPYASSLYRQGQQAYHSDEDVVRLQQWLNENYKRATGAEEMAKMLGISVRTLNRRFRASLDLSPLEYINQLKQGHAKELLKQTNLSIAEVADACGYSSASYFSRIFRSKFGLSPAEYRTAVKTKLFTAEQ